VHREHSVPVGERQLLDGNELREAGCVEDAVDPAELSFHRPDRLLDGGLVGDVARERDRPVEPGRDGLGALAIEVDHRHPAFLGGEAAGGRRREAGAAAGGEQDLAGEPRASRPSRPSRT
jgi:hypothetical protein